jgi:hypothetical protein
VPDQSQEPEVIYLVATCANANFGDEFIAAAWLRFLAQERPDAEVWLDCPQPGVASHFFGDLHPRLRTTDALWRVVWETQGMRLEDATAHVDERITNLGSPLYDIALLGARRATTVHLLGGGHVNSMWVHHLGLLRAAGQLKRLSGARLFATGLGLMPMEHPDRVREDLAAFDHVTVRDRQSAERTGAELAADDSMLGIDRVPGFTARAQAGPVDTDVWVCLQSDVADPGALDAAVAAAREFLTDPALAGRTVRYLEGIPGVDRVAYDQLTDLIPEENFVSFLELWGQGFPGRAGQTWFTSRYHFHLMAAACGAAGTAVEVNSEFYGVKHGSLLDAGTGWGVVKSGEKLPSPASIDPEFRVTAARMQRMKRAEAERLYPRPAPSTAPVEAPARTPWWSRRS